MTSALDDEFGDEFALIAALVDLIDRDLVTVREIIGTLSVEALTMPSAKVVFGALRQVVETIARPTVADVGRALEGDREQGSPAWALVVLAVKDMRHTGPHAPRLAREAAARLQEHYASRRGGAP
jgi:hypothetical protein